jgi:hypothetical protein
VACWSWARQKGKQETALGEIAFLVHIRFRDAQQHEGVAFLEAKKREWPGEKYAALKEGPAKRIAKNTSYAKALLFEHAPSLGLNVHPSVWASRPESRWPR